MKDSIDIISVTYGQNENLKCFINSIKSQYNPNWKLYLIHDGPNESLKNDLLLNGYLNEKVLFIEYPERTNNFGHILRGWGIKNLAENQYVLLTNGDNYYTPNMVDEVLKINSDLIYFNCIHSHKNKTNNNKSSYGFMNCELVRSKIDMGCVVVKTNLAKEVGFNDISYDSDWLYFEKLLSLSPKISKIDKVLFVHN